MSPLQKVASGVVQWGTANRIQDEAERRIVWASGAIFIYLRTTCHERSSQFETRSEALLHVQCKLTPTCMRLLGGVKIYRYDKDALFPFVIPLVCSPLRLAGYLQHGR